MGWFRKNRRWGAGFAVFALACHIALSFAHVHAWGFGPRAATALIARLAAQLPAADRSADRTNAEFTRIKNIATVENCVTPVGPQGNCPDSGTPVAFEPPFNILDTSDKLGWQFGAYVADEWHLTPQLTLNYGLRFDQIFQYVDKDQLSPRAALNYTPWWGTVFHAGYMRTFQPPAQVLGRTVPNGLFFATTGAPEVANSGSILPERANLYDIGIVQQILPRCPEASTSITPAWRSATPLAVPRAG